MRALRLRWHDKLVEIGFFRSVIGVPHYKSEMLKYIKALVPLINELPDTYAEQLHDFIDDAEEFPDDTVNQYYWMRQFIRNITGFLENEVDDADAVAEDPVVGSGLGGLDLGFKKVRGGFHLYSGKVKLTLKPIKLDMEKVLGQI